MAKLGTPGGIEPRDRAAPESADHAAIVARTSSCSVAAHRLRLGVAGLLASACRAPSPAPESLSDPWRFSDGERIEDVRWSPPIARAGGSIEIEWTGTPGVQRGLVWGLVPSQAAGWQEYPRTQATRWVSPRAQWRSVPRAGRTNKLELRVPAAWRDRSATLVAYRQEDERMLAVHSGARLPSSDPPVRNAARVAVLGVIELTSRPLHLDVPRLPTPPNIDGQLSDWPPDLPRYALVDSLNGSAVHERATQVAFAWDDQNLYLHAVMQDPDLWAPDKERDAPLFRKEALEIFIAADGSGFDYLELELSAANVIFDARFSRPRRGDRSYDGPWAHAVTVRGTLNHRKDRDRGWTAEVALPWAELCAQTRLSCPVRLGTTFRVNVFRLETPRRRAQVGTALAPIFRPDFHAMDAAAFLHLGP